MKLDRIAFIRSVEQSETTIGWQKILEKLEEEKKETKTWAIDTRKKKLTPITCK